MQVNESHILSWILFTPLLGAIVLLLVPRERDNMHRVIGNAFGMLGFLVSLPLIWRFPIGSPGYQFRENADWIPSIGAHYSLGIDGISFLLVMLTTILGAISILSSWSAIRTRTKEYYILFLLLQTGMLGVFMSLDFFLFYLFWEVMLVPMYFLIGVWGSDRRLYAAIKFFLYTLAGSVLMLLAILALYYQAHQAAGAGAAYTFDIPTLLGVVPQLSTTLQRILFWGFFFAFAIKVPMFPFHTWLPDAHTEAPTAGSVILAGVLLKMGTYGFIRFSLPLLPTDPAARQHIVTILMVLSIVGIVYGALVCMMQKDMKKLIAYSSVSHLGFCTLGIFALNPQGVAGSVIQQINHGISTGALFLIIGVLYERRHTRLISEFGGLSTPMPNFAAIYMIATLSSLGLPLLNGFIGEFTILSGVFTVRPALGGLGRDRHRAWRRLSAVALSAGHVRAGHQSSQRALAGFERARVCHADSAGAAGFLDWNLSQAAVPCAGSARAADRGAGESGLLQLGHGATHWRKESRGGRTRCGDSRNGPHRGA